MGVRVVAVTKPISGEMRAAMRILGREHDPRAKPTPYIDRAARDAASFDSVPGIGFDTNASAAMIVPRPGRIDGEGAVLALDPAQNNTFRAINRALAAGLDVQIDLASTPIRYLIPGLSDDDQNELVSSLSLVAARTTSVGRSLERPRVGLLNVPTSMDAGWTRWVLERYGFNYAHVSAGDIAAGALEGIDVLIVTDEPRGLSGSRGSADSAGWSASIARLDAFIQRGGTLVCLNRSSAFAIDQLKLPVKNVLAGLTRQEFFTGGSLLQVKPDISHPVMAGMPAEAAVFVQGSPAFETFDGFRGSVLARYADTGSPLLSGYLIGEKYLNGKAVAVDVQHGSGHVVLIGFRPQWRGQSFGTFRVLFNAALYGHRKSSTATSAR
jgi:hypothetical protein